MVLASPRSSPKVSPPTPVLQLRTGSALVTSGTAAPKEKGSKKNFPPPNVKRSGLPGIREVENSSIPSATKTAIRAKEPRRGRHVAHLSRQAVPGGDFATRSILAVPFASPKVKLPMSVPDDESNTITTESIVKRSTTHEVLGELPRIPSPLLYHKDSRRALFGPGKDEHNPAKCFAAVYGRDPPNPDFGSHKGGPSSGPPAESPVTPKIVFDEQQEFIGAALPDMSRAVIPKQLPAMESPTSFEYYRNTRTYLPRGLGDIKSSNRFHQGTTPPVPGADEEQHVGIPYRSSTTQAVPPRKAKITHIYPGEFSQRPFATLPSASGPKRKVAPTSGLVSCNHPSAGNNTREASEHHQVVEKESGRKTKVWSNEERGARVAPEADTSVLTRQLVIDEDQTVSKALWSAFEKAMGPSPPRAYCGNATRGLWAPPLASNDVISASTSGKGFMLPASTQNMTECDKTTIVADIDGLNIPLQSTADFAACPSPTCAVTAPGRLFEREHLGWRQTRAICGSQSEVTKDDLDVRAAAPGSEMVDTSRAADGLPNVLLKKAVERIVKELGFDDRHIPSRQYATCLNDPEFVVIDNNGGELPAASVELESDGDGLTRTDVPLDGPPATNTCQDIALDGEDGYDMLLPSPRDEGYASGHDGHLEGLPERWPEAFEDFEDDWEWPGEEDELDELVW